MASFFYSVVRSKGMRTVAYTICFLIGVGISSVYVMDVVVWIGIMIAIILLFILKNKSSRFVMVGIIIFCAGVLRVLVINEVVVQTDVQRYEVNIIGEVEYRSKSQRAIAMVDNQKTLLWLERYPVAKTGDIIKFTCALQKPEPFEGFAYDKYLLSRGISQQCSRLKNVRIIAGESSITRSIFSLKETFSQTINKLFPEPHASFLAGILYGERAGIPKQYTEQFEKTGTSHILAISGYNITILTIAILAALTSLLVPRKKAVWAVIIGVSLFVIFVGSGASVVRAAIMGMVPLFARMIGRLTSPVFVLMHVAGLMVLHRPLILIYDPGFQLSFVATLGLIILTPKLLKKTSWLPDDTLDFKQTAAATLSAIIFTLPLILFHFGQLSLTALPVNLLTIPFMPLVMATGFIAMLLGMIHPVLGIIAATIPYLILSYILFIIDWFSGVPFGAIAVEFSWIHMIVAYSMLLYVMYRPHSKSRSIEAKKIDGITWKIVEA